MESLESASLRSCGLLVPVLSAVSAGMRRAQTNLLMSSRAKPVTCTTRNSQGAERRIIICTARPSR